ncbi:MAG TPA: tRNA (adenosine(37)-N6)-threonylcarbamoyltransferase complex transferase subunit TsaD [candidate division WOR-3 bacterium]|uniref:tRNA N6-adenosine threonylcarbamoyltransferase n=1 Tax=candidate division WOR-3 bacterium TaxID=2052148 RepID=A0A7V0T4Q2_UNCW3|nr:tRNA (adenosine(37)-N6)-threonylcarbamoyltransferase complex transferase subunit TsaD [candidate division WOR-3 bacterium]
MKECGLCLAIETSCDETAAAVLAGRTCVRANVVSSQYVHARYGGVVPELAARAHAQMVVPVCRAALDQTDAGFADLDCIAATFAPGLMGALLVGLPFAKALARSLDVPFVGVNHLEGHLFALRLSFPDLTPPFLGAVLSGGHTELIVVEDWCRYHRLGGTLDDACGEAFDKVAKLLGLPYPGGARVEELASRGRPTVAFPLPVAGAGPDALDFSFSGLKTAVRYRLRDHDDEPADIAASFQHAAVEGIGRRLVAARHRTGLTAVGVSGGVAANRRLRERLAELAAEHGFRLLVPKMCYCTDNAAMIAAAGVERLARFGPSPLSLAARARAPLQTETGPAVDLPVISS